MAAANIPQECENAPDKYKKIFRIGCGTFGEAWLVSSLCSGRNYVMKEVKVSDFSEEELEKTHREAMVLSRCKHINVIRYKESFLLKNPTTMCLVMEYADGGDLFERVKQSKLINKLIPEETILHWFIQIIIAVQYLHKNHILHRDLKTQNIFLTYQNLVKVGDFGIARVLRTKQELATTAIGTPYYLSPEICLRKPYSYKSDMWSLGCILYELCTLNHPFEANDFETLVLRILVGVYTPLSREYSNLMHDLTAVLLRTNPEKRPSADDVLIIPALRLFVREYILRHLPSVTSPKQSDSPSVQERVTLNADSPASEAIFPPVLNDVVVSSEVERNLIDGRGTPEKDNIENVEGSSKTEHLPMNQHLNELKIAEVEFGESFYTPSKLNKRRDSQTQTPPEWNTSKSEKIERERNLKHVSGVGSANSSPLLKSNLTSRIFKMNEEDPKLNSLSKDKELCEVVDSIKKSNLGRTYPVSSEKILT